MIWLHGLGAGQPGFASQAVMVANGQLRRCPVILALVSFPNILDLIQSFARESLICQLNAVPFPLSPEPCALSTS